MGLCLITFCVMGIRLLCCDRLKIIPIEGKLGFTDTYIPDASLCIPAAYAGFHDDIEGEYRINGKTYGSQSLRERVSIHPQKGLLISRNWLSDTGFQQHVLVKDGKVRSEFASGRQTGYIVTKYKSNGVCVNNE